MPYASRSAICPGFPESSSAKTASQLFGVDLDPEVLRWSRDRPERGSGDAPLRRQGRCRCRRRRRPSPYPRDLLDDQPPTAFETRRNYAPDFPANSKTSKKRTKSGSQQLLRERAVERANRPLGRRGGPAGYPHCCASHRDVSGAMNTRSCGVPGEDRDMNYREAKVGALLDAREWREFPR